MRHEYEYDEQGRVTAHVEERESSWTREEVDLLLASREVENDVSSQHGHPMSEALAGDPADERAPHYYEVGLPMVDYAEKARLDAIDAYKREYGSESAPPNLNGFIFPVVKKLRR